MAPKLSVQTISASLLKVCMHRQRHGTECGVQYGRLLSCSLDVGVPISSHRVDTRLVICVRSVHTRYSYIIISFCLPYSCMRDVHEHYVSFLYDTVTSVGLYYVPTVNESRTGLLYGTTVVVLYSTVLRKTIFIYSGLGTASTVESTTLFLDHTKDTHARSSCDTHSGQYPHTQPSDWNKMLTGHCDGHRTSEASTSARGRAPTTHASSRQTAVPFAVPPSPVM